MPPTRTVPPAVLVVAFACAVAASMLLAHSLGRDAITGLILGGALGGVLAGLAKWPGDLWKQISHVDREHH